MRTTLAVALLVSLAFPVCGQEARYAADQRELGPVVLLELALTDGKLVFRTHTGGCTNAGSFAVDVVVDAGVVPGTPLYRLTIRRVRVDECKGLFPEGILNELDLADDLGLSGRFTVTVENPVLVRPAAER